MSSTPTRWITELPEEVMRNLCICTLLDPRFKLWKFKGAFRACKDQALKWSRDEWLVNWKKRSGEEDATAAEGKPAKKTQKKKKSVQDLLSSDEESEDDDEVNSSCVQHAQFTQVFSSCMWCAVQCSETPAHVTVLDELTLYLQEKQEPRSCDTLAHWKARKQLHPNLEKMARQKLAIPATSAGVER